jgi:flagellar hook-basal body complex protein FliE
MQDIIAIQPVSMTMPSLKMENELGVFSSQGEGQGFGDLLANKISSIDSSLKSADQAMVSYIKGDDIPTHEIIIAMGKAKSELRLALEIRNKLVDSYKEIARMHV